MARTEIDRDKLRVQLRRLRKDDLLDLLDRAIDLVPKTRLPALVKGYVKPADLRPDRAIKGGLLQAVRKFRKESLRGDFYEDFMVNSRNFREKSRGTETWISECTRLLDRCVEAVKKCPHQELREAFELLLGLLRHVDEGHEDVVFFADEAGSWQVGVEWRKVLPVYFTVLAGTSAAEEYAGAVEDVIKDFVDYDKSRYLKVARAAASPAQKKELRGG